jgi:hypothetical protein
VLLARNFNPSIASKEWLYGKDILREVAVNFLHTPPLSVVETEAVSFVLDENRLQISLKNISPENIELLQKIAGSFVSCLPETPFSAAGFNYTYDISKEGSNLKGLSMPNNVKLKELFSESYELGVIVSFPFEEFIVRMSAPPTRDEATRIKVSFNFHSDCRNADEVRERLKLYSKTMERTEEIIKGISG